MSSRRRIEAEVTRMLIRLARRWRQEADGAVASLGLSHASGWTLLRLGRIDGADVGVRQSDLAAELDMSAPSLVPQLDRLAATGLVVREADDEDRRANRVRLTVDGRAMVGRIERRLDGIRSSLMGDIDDADLAVALEALMRFDRQIAERRDTSA